MDSQVQEALGSVEEALSNADLTTDKLITAVIITVVGLIAINIVTSILERALGGSRMDSGPRSAMKVVLRVVLGFVLLLIVMGYLNIEITSFIAIFSIMGLAISLAVQNLLSNVAGGIQIYSTKPFAVGHYVETGGVAGTVVEAGIFYTKLLDFNNKLILIPNSEIAKVQIINYSAEPLRRVELKIPASYEDDVEKVKSVICRVLGEHPKTMATPAPTARVDSYGDSGIVYVVRVWCANEEYWEVYYDIMEQIKAAFDANGITIPYPQMVLHHPKEN